jgi:hypothetical protein
LDDAKCVIVVWSRYSVVSEFVQEEADDGRERKILIPVCIDKVRPPLGFRAIQHEDFTDWKGESHHPRARNLIKSVERIAGKPEKSVVESSVTPMVEVEQETEGKFLKAKHNSKEPHENSSVAKIFISIALFIVVFARWLYIRRAGFGIHIGFISCASGFTNASVRMNSHLRVDPQPTGKPTTSGGVISCHVPENLITVSSPSAVPGLNPEYGQLVRPVYLQSG